MIQTWKCVNILYLALDNSHTFAIKFLSFRRSCTDFNETLSEFHENSWIPKENLSNNFWNFMNFGGLGCGEGENNTLENDGFSPRRPMFSEIYRRRSCTIAPRGSSQNAASARAASRPPPKFTRFWGNSSTGVGFFLRAMLRKKFESRLKRKSIPNGKWKHDCFRAQCSTFPFLRAMLREE